MGHTGGPENIPVRTVDGTLVPGDQCRHHARNARALRVGVVSPPAQSRKDAVAHSLAQLLNGVLPGRRHAHRGIILGARAHGT